MSASGPTPVQPAPLVLIGGLAMRAAELDPLVAALGERGVAAVAFDNLMVGDGPRPAGPLTVAAQARHAWGEVDRRFGGEAGVTLFGISMGGMIAATMAEGRPARVRHLVLGATSPNLPAAGLEAVPQAAYDALQASATEAALRAGLAFAFGRTTVAERPELVRAYADYRLAKGNGQSRRDFLAQLDSIRAFPGEAVYGALRALGLPVTVVAGDEDRLFPAAHTDFLAAQLRAGWHRVFRRTGHMLHLEKPGSLVDVLVKAASGSTR